MATILYQIPGDLSAGPLGRAELERRKGLLRRWAFPSSTVDVADAPGGPLSIESYAEELLSVAPMIRALQARPVQPDAIIVGCFGDPGVPALREIFESVVVGPFEASFHLAAQLGRRVGVVTVLDSVVPLLDHLVRGMGQSLNYAGAVAVQVSVLDLAAEGDTLAARVAAAAQPLVDRGGADVLVLGCMSMAFLDIAGDVARLSGVPTINPARAALATAEALTALGVSQSRKTYPKPPKAVSA